MKATIKTVVALLKVIDWKFSTWLFWFSSISHIWKDIFFSLINWLGLGACCRVDEASSHWNWEDKNKFVGGWFKGYVEEKLKWRGLTRSKVLLHGFKSLMICKQCSINKILQYRSIYKHHSRWFLNVLLNIHSQKKFIADKNNDMHNFIIDI